MYKGGGGINPTEHAKGNFNHGSEVFKDAPKPKRYGEDALNKRLLGRKIRLSLVNSQTIEGTLSNLGMYDLSLSAKVQEKFGALIRDSERVIIVMKAAIVTVEVIP
jgi:hypothetical protein